MKLEGSLEQVELSHRSLRPGWVLLLDSGATMIYVFRGFLSTTQHRAKAFEMAFLLRQERTVRFVRSFVRSFIQ